MSDGHVIASPKDEAISQLRGDCFVGKSALLAMTFK
jgi:hypothetical protein